jgi:hypothetical protein
VCPVVDHRTLRRHRHRLQGGPSPPRTGRVIIDSGKFGPMRKPRSALVLAVVATVLLSGCSGFLGGGGAQTPTEATPYPTPTGNATAEQLRSAAIDAIDDTESYAFEGRVFQDFREDINVTATLNTSGRVDRADRRLVVNETQSSGARTYAVSTYVVDGTVYSNSAFYRQDYDSAWISRTPENFSDYWSGVDVLDRQRAVLSAANVSVLGAETIDGTETTVVNATLTPAEYGRLLNATPVGVGAGDVTVETASFRFWIVPDSGRLLRSSATLNLTVETAGRTAALTQRTTVDYGGYDDPVEVSLPEGAADAAVDVSDP